MPAVLRSLILLRPRTIQGGFFMLRKIVYSMCLGLIVMLILRPGGARNQHYDEPEAHRINNFAKHKESSLDCARPKQNQTSQYCWHSNASSAARGRLSTRCHLFAQFLLARCGGRAPAIVGSTLA